ncbi:uncharacterized protein LOC124915111 [Impatiens glandulifera]|uniref:uncharacterized protein LOC124915111 n=1 Tax=Impatiens glandulifera TaxID=253017 RepID=UPI001FB0919D|nr:uncharacterized protein LOC124915111 [Impatiens glandulifera]
MSGGSPMGGGVGGLMRQRHSHGYSSGGEDLEDDASSRLRPQPPLIQLTRSWTEIIENIVWIVSTTFILFYGDGNFNFLFLLCHDHRIKRVELYIGMGGVMLNAIFIFLAWNFRKSGEKWDVSNSSALPYVVMIGVISFCLLSFALWPIWSFLTLPLLFTLLITGVVTVPYIVLLVSKKSQTDLLRID